MERPALSSIFTPEAIAAIPKGQWRPVPDVDDRVFWNGIDDTTRRGIVAHAERRAAQPWPTLPASLWLDYVRTGNRIHYEDPYFDRRDRLASAVLAACMTDEPRWHDEVLDGVWQLLEETTWCIPPHDGFAHDDTILPDPDRPTLDLFAAETGSVLAWTHTVLGQRLKALAPIAEKRLVTEVRRRVLEPYRRIDTWVWLGHSDQRVNNWNPWINSNVLAASLLLESDPGEINLTVERAVKGLDKFVGDYPDDGGCEEGAVYWWRAAASLYECLQTLYEASNGELNAFTLPIIGEMARYLPRVHVAGDWYVNLGDGAAKLDKENYSAHLLWHFGRQAGADDVARLGRSMRGDSTVVETEAPLGRSLSRTLRALADTAWANEPPTPPPLPQHTWLPDTELLIARHAGGDTSGLMFSLAGGNNGVSHNHNDVGTISVALDGQPLIVDAGVSHYTREHFGPRRYELWQMRSDYHNVPTVDGVEQRAGGQFRARDFTCELSDEAVRADLELRDAYPSEAGIESWHRSVHLDRGAQRLEITEDVRLDHDPSSVGVRLLTAVEPIHERAGRFLLRGAERTLAVDYDPALLSTAIDTIELDDRRLRSVWGSRLWRVTLGMREPAPTARWTVNLAAL